MLLTMRAECTQAEAKDTLGFLQQEGVEAVLVPAPDRQRIVVLAGEVDPHQVLLLPGVEAATPVLSQYKLASRETCPEDTIIRIGDLVIGGDEPVVAAGPCAVENRVQTLETAKIIQSAGANLFRGGAYKPRTSPYAFQGLGEAGLEILGEVRETLGLPVVSEVVSIEDLPIVSEYVDILQIGARNMQNFPLLLAAGETGLPVLLKRGISATITEWLMAAEYILSTGNRNVILCERGIRTYEPLTRNTLDLSAVAAAKIYSHLPVIVDPSHGTGLPELIPPLSRAALAAGADGLIVEVHPEPGKAKCDGFQALTGPELVKLVADAKELCQYLRMLKGAE